MSETEKTIYIYTMPQELPCGPGSGCCGPIGQTDMEISRLRSGLEQMLPGIRTEIINVREKLSLPRDAAALKVIRAFGAVALPVLVLDGQVVSIGPPNGSELVAALRAKLAPAGTPAPAR